MVEEARNPAEISADSMPAGEVSQTPTTPKLKEILRHGGGSVGKTLKATAFAVASLLMSGNSSTKREARPDETILLERKFNLWNYQVGSTPEDESRLQEWKSKIDEAIEATKTELEKPFDQRAPLLQNIFGENPTGKDIQLYCIANFLFQNRMQPFDKLAVFGELTNGIPQPLTQIGLPTDNCIQISVIAQELAKTYGIEGAVTKEPEGTDHTYWQEVIDQKPTGSIIDTYWGKPRNGFIQNPDDWGKVVREDYLKDGLPESLDWFYLGRSLPGQ